MIKHLLGGKLLATALTVTLISGCSHLPSQSPSQTEGETSKASSKAAPLKLPINDPVIEETPATISFENTIEVTNKRFSGLKQDANLSNHLQHALVFQAPTEPYHDLWQKLSQHIFIAPAHLNQYKNYQRYYLKNKSHLKRVSKRAKPYLHFVMQEIDKRHMPYEIALLPVVESGYYPFAKSYVSASGLWQFMPATGYMYGLHRNWWYDGRQDVYHSTQAALRYLQKLYVLNDYDWLLALASYNGGYGNVLKAKKKYRKKHPNGNADFWQIRPYLPKETQHYVPQLLAISNLVANQAQYGIELEPIANQPYFKTIEIRQQLSLPKIAKATQTKLEALQILNPGFLRMATPPQGKHKLLLPIDVADALESDLLNNPKNYRVKWARHKIQSGESLSVIAEKYGTSSKQIRQLNGMKNNRIRAGKTLLIPVPESYKLAKTKTKKYRGKKHTHKVKSGESLWTIAKYYNTTPRKLCEWNRISIRDPLRKGQKLVIHSNKYGRKLSHTIKKGESLWTVAKKYKVTTTELCNWNGIKKSHVLQPGKRLNVWVKS